MKEIKLKADWIWCPHNDRVDDKVIFRKTFELDRIVDTAVTYIAIDTKYWLYINEEMVVFEGGLFRESKPGCGYVDKIDIAPYLVLGKNVISLFCWFYGNEGRNNTNSKEAGLIFECNDLQMF